MKNKFINAVYTDYYKAYESILENENHVQSKAETYTVEGYNSNLRHYLARLKRKTRCYSKCDKMLEYSVKLLMAKWNKDLAMLK